MNPQDQSGNVPQQQSTEPVAPQQPTPQADGAGVPAAQPQPPQNEQPQADEAGEKKIAVEFEPDLTLYITADTVNDMRFLELYEQVATSQIYIPKLLKFIFGEEKYEGIHAYYQRKGQKFTITKMEQVFEKLDRDLNSNPDFLK